MMTSRAEYRLLLRQDNADLRLTEKGYKVGLISEERFNRFKMKKEQIENEIERLKTTVVKPSQKLNEFLVARETNSLGTGAKLSELLKRTEITYKDLEQFDVNRKELPKDVIKEVETQLKYEGYIKMQEAQVDKFRKLEKKELREDIDYKDIKGLSLEARQKLDKHKPLSVGQASRISGVSPADISVLLIYLEQNRRKKE